MSAPHLRVNEIFFSLQGEGTRSGLPTAFIRLTGCPLRCRYCDTAHAFSEGSDMGLGDIITRVLHYRTRHVLVTGGEPLMQQNCGELLHALCERGLDVALETSGAFDIGGLDPRVARIMDIKTPGSGEVDRNRWENIELLGLRDEVKFVICHHADYLWAREVVQARGLLQSSQVLFSPAAGELEARELAEWVLRDHLPVRVQIQLHKLLWGAERGR